jgi:hypothetical protein
MVAVADGKFGKRLQRFLGAKCDPVLKLSWAFRLQSRLRLCTS